jgi:peptidoglycan hydrolase-like protein with peptidoglycan-binding domain
MEGARDQEKSSSQSPAPTQGQQPPSADAGSGASAAKKDAATAGDFAAQEAALKPPSPYPKLGPGSRGDAVSYLQNRLNTVASAGLTPDGSYGGGTQKAVVAFQKERKLTPDGAVGMGTWDAIEGKSPVAAAGKDQGANGDKKDPAAEKKDAAAEKPAGGDKGVAGGDKKDAAKPKPAPWKSYPTLWKGSNGPFVKKLQNLLTACGFQVDTSGTFDENTKAALKAFQKAKGLKDDGLCGGSAWEKLFAEGGSVGLGPAEKDPPDARIQALIQGKFAGKGQYRPTGDGFVDGDLDALLTEYGKFWKIDVRGKAKVAEKKKDAGGGGGGIETAGGAIEGNPAWVEVLQAELYTSGEWTPDHAATQKLLQAYLNAFSAASGGLNSTVEEFYRHVGGSEENGQAGALGGSKGAMNWCQEASTRAVINGLLRKGLRFKTGGARPKQLMHELGGQLGALTKWMKSGSAGVLSGKAAWDAELKAGDLFSIVGQGPLTGHAATAAGQVGDTIQYVSGNAGGGLPGNGAIKAEQVKRGTPPPEYAQIRPLIEAKVGAQENQKTYENNAKMMGNNADKAEKSGNTEGAKTFRTAEADMSAKAEQFGTKLKEQEAKHPEVPTSRTDPRFKEGVHGPKAGEVWVVAVTRTSKLDANALMAVDDSVLAKEGLERCGPLETVYPDFAKVMGT